MKVFLCVLMLAILSGCQLEIANPYRIAYEVTGTGSAYIQIMDDASGVATNRGLKSLPWRVEVWPKTRLAFTFVSAEADLGQAVSVQTWICGMDCGQVTGMGWAQQALNCQY